VIRHTALQTHTHGTYTRRDMHILVRLSVEYCTTTDYIASLLDSIDAIALNALDLSIAIYLSVYLLACVSLD